MTRAALEQRAAYLAKLAGFKEATPAPSWTTLVQQAEADFSWEAEYNAETTTFVSVLNQAEYTIALPAFKFFTDAIWNDVTPLFQTTEEQVRQSDPTWITAPIGTPRYWWTANPNIIRLYPKPATADITVTLRGIREAAALSSASAVPGFPSRWHEAIACRAAFLYAEAYATGEEDIARITSYDQTFTRMAADCRKWIGSEDAPVERRVSSMMPDRIRTGGGLWYWRF